MFKRKQPEYKFRNLVFEGGGIKGLAYVGALRVLEKKKILGQIERFAGTSAGAITAALLAIGFNLDELEKTLKQTDFNEFKDDSFFLPLNLLRLYNKYGWYKGNSFKKWFDSAISKKVSPDLTFKDLQKLYEKKKAKLLYVVGTNVNKKKEVVFSHETTPNTKISDAVRISMSLPFFFEAVDYDKNIFVDGGIFYNYPIDIFDKKKYLFDKSNFDRAPYDPRKGIIYNKETLGFRVDTVEEIKHHLKSDPLPETEIKSLKHHIQAIIGALIDIANKKHIHKNDWHRTIHIDALGISTTQFSLTEKQKKDLIKSGENCTKNYFKWFDNPVKGEKPLNK